MCSMKLFASSVKKLKKDRILKNFINLNEESYFDKNGDLVVIEEDDQPLFFNVRTSFGKELSYGMANEVSGSKKKSLNLLRKSKLGVDLVDDS
mmetsp:Transcript_24800/g.24309  ORF Transcript_24800/g.24309 Transcript_24800/m.24309 type:complete len:93 (+) Transcript_24800:394-672(+)